MTPAPMHIVFAEPYDESAVQRMRSVGRVTVLDACDEATLCEAVSDCDALLVRTYSKVSDAVLARAGRPEFSVRRPLCAANEPSGAGAGAFCSGSGAIGHEHRRLIEASADSKLDLVLEGRVALRGRADS